MYLKSLVLKGFKSFADRASLHVEPGVTVVVGPNGSGKSNISDAVLWVLGEQSAKQLRGSAMEDVIFAGSSARQAVGVAEVDLVLDNSDGTLPIEFKEVAITRRMYRSGESEYLINGSPARLMDILDLLHDSGLGRDTQSIISQGRLDSILNSRPEDRRALIEEAAGVLKHKKRRERSLRKLAAMDAHLARAKDIAVEIERQVRPLQRQATRAQEHAGLQAELRDLELALAVDDLRALKEQWNAVLHREKEADADLELSRYRLSEKDRELEKFQQLLEEKGLFVGDLSEQRRRIQSIIERIDTGLLLLEEKGKNMVEKLSELRSTLYQSERRATQHKEDLEKYAGERQETAARLQALYTQLNEIKRDSEAIRKDRALADESLSRITADLRRRKKDLDDDRLLLAAAEKKLSTFDLENDLLNNRIEQIGEQKTAAQTTLSARRTRLEQVEDEGSRVKKELSLAESDVDRRVRVLDDRKRKLEGSRERLSVARAEMKGLEEIDRAFTAVSPALEWAMEHKGELGGFIGPVAELFSAPEAYEKLVENLLGPDLFGLLVSDLDAATSVAERLSKAAQGEITLMPLSSAGSPLHGKPATGERLLDLLTFEKGDTPAAEALLGDVYVVKSLKDGLAAAKGDKTGARFVTQDGEVVWPNGKITMGAQVSDIDGVLVRKRRLGQLEEEMDSLVTEVASAEVEVSQAEEALSAAQVDALEISQKIAGLSGENDSLLEEIGRLEQAITSLSRDEENVKTRLDELHAKNRTGRPEVDGIASRIEVAQGEVDKLEEEEHVAREERERKFRDESEIASKLSACQVEIATVSEREVHLKSQVNAITREIGDLDEIVKTSRETEAAYELLRLRVQPIHDLYSAMQERAAEWAHKLHDRASVEQADSESIRTTISNAQEAVRTVQAEIEKKNEVLSQIKIEKGQYELQVELAVKKIIEENGVSLEAALEVDPVDNRVETENRAHKLRRKISQIGPVNPIAMQEFEALKERRDFMASQIDDLEGSRKALSKIVAAIDRKIRDSFLETFETVDKNFQEIFSVLFPGGSSQLQLSDPDNPDETGIEVIAQPRGKKLTKMMLMSGGEKSLTALALLFAVYKTRPVPFYILDEVEAALDDTNLRRFVSFVDSMRHQTQFIIVSHQRRTMEMADVLYGVSMQADGVSKVVSQKLDGALQHAEG